MLVMRLAVLMIIPALYLIPSHSLSAKGLDDLSPEVPTAEDVDKKVEEKETDGGSDLNITEGDVQAIDKVSQDISGSVEEKKEAVEPSAASKLLADKLYLTASLGGVFLAKSKGSWKSSNLGSDLSLGYKVIDAVMPKTDLYATFRYLPINVTVKENMQSYQGMIEVYKFGAAAKYKISETFRAFGSSEMGLVKISLRSVDEFKEDSSLEDGHLHLAVGGGTEWLVSEKLLAGPSLTVGFGAIQIVKLSANLSFMF